MGKIIFKEAKYSIFKGVFGFKDFKNWDSVRFEYRAEPFLLQHWFNHLLNRLYRLTPALFYISLLYNYFYFEINSFKI